MPRDDDQSLGEQPTYQGGRGDDPPSQGDAPSLGDEMTLGGTSPSSGDTFDDGMEVVDLSSRYTVEGTLGKGGMGEVLLATDTRLNRKVAIKRVLGDGAKSQTAVKRFLTEAQSIAALNHFNIVQIYDYGRDSDGPFLIMEHVDGGSLLDKCREGALPLEEAVELTCQLCDGLEMAHAAGIIHRDIKPANVLMTSRGEPKLTDFGLARQDTADTGQTMAGAVLGTLDFMPPEQRKDATTADHRSDLWSLAATLYQLVTGKSPKIIRFNDVPESLQDALGKALEEAPGDRYQSAGEFRQALQTSVQESSGGPTRDLKTGECRSCGHANDPGRKFCQSCGGPLTEPCLSCQQSNGVWETFCASCGVNQEQLAESKITELSEQRSRVDSLCREYRYDDALQIVAGLADQTHPRFSEFPAWAQETRPEIEREYAEAKAERERLIGEARSLMGQQEYGAVPRLFESLAKGLWNSDVQGLIMQAEQSEKEAAELLTNIKQLVRDRSYEGLLEKTERFLELRPDRKDIREIHATLSKRAGKRAEKQAVRDKVRSAEILDEVREKMRAKDFASVVMLLADMPEGYETEESMDLLRKAQVRVEQSEKLLKQIDKAVKKGQTSRLLPKLDDYLKLVSTDERIESLREKLAAQQRVLQRKVKAGLAGVCLLVVTVTVGMYLKSRADEKAQAIAAAVESQSWATVLTLDSGNTQALLGRAQNRLNADPPEFDGALADLQAAEAEDPQTEGLQPLKATVYARRAGVQADADQIDKAEADLKAAESLDVAPAELVGVRGKLAGAHLREAQGLAAAGQLTQAIASRDKAVTYGADAAALQPFNDGLAGAYLKQAESLTLTSKYPEALDAVESAKLLNASLPRIAGVEAAVYVQRARTSLKDGERDAASADFLLARKLDGKTQGLGQLAAGLTDGLVQRCEDTFTDAAFEEATAALATVTELEPDSESLPGLKDRLGKVLVSQGDAALADGSLPRVGAIIESLQTLAVLPDDQTRLANALPAAASRQVESAVEDADVEAAAVALKTAVDLPLLTSEQRDQILAVSAESVQQLVMQGLESSQPTETARSLAALKTLSGISAVTNDLRDQLKALPGGLQEQLPPGLLIPSPAVTPFDATQAKAHQQAWADYLGVPVESTNSFDMKFVVIPPGEFMMGSPEDEAGREPDETLHTVTLTQSFQMGMHEVTQEQYEKVTGTNSSNLKGPQKPVEQVSWDEAVEFCRKLSALPAEKSSGYMYRLPTEAEWEYACRAGTTTKYSFGDSESELGEYAWYGKNSGKTTHPVGGKKPNPWGLYDMHGNVWEWCQDRCEKKSGDYPSSSVTDPNGPALGTHRRYRGGSQHFPDNSGTCRSAYRNAGGHDARQSVLGFRVLRVAATPPELMVDWLPKEQWKPGGCVARLATVRHGITTPLRQPIAVTTRDFGADYFCVRTHDAGSTTDIHDLSITDADTGTVFYHNDFSKSDLTDFAIQKTGDGKVHVVDGHLRVEGHGFKQNGGTMRSANTTARLKRRLPKNFTISCTLARMQWAGHQFVFLLSDAAPSNDQSDVAFHLIERSITLTLKASGSKFGPVSIATNGSTHTLVIVKQGNKVTATVNGKQVADTTLAPTASPPIRVLPEGTLTTGTDTFELVGDELRLREDADITAAQSDFPLTLRCAWSQVTETTYSITPASRLAERIEYKATDFTKGLVAYYPFDGNAKDESGNGNDGLVSKAKLVAGRHRDSDGAYDFTNADAIQVPTQSSLNLTTTPDFTLSLWAQKRGQSQFTFALNKGNGRGSADKWTVNVGYYENGQGQPKSPYLGFHWQVRGKPQWAFSEPIKWDKAWHHFVITRNSDTFHFFMDSKLIGTVRNPNPLVDTSGPLRIGRSADSEPPFAGALDDIRIYNRALSAAEVKALYDYESQPPGQPVGQAPPPAVAPFDATQAKAHQKAWADYLSVPVETTNSIGMKFAVIPPGEFMMGSPKDEPGRNDDETLHKVTLTQPFQMGMHEVTQEQYQTVMGTNPSDRKGPQNPVEMVSWNDAVEFCRKLSEQPEEKAAGSVYRLPTEAEWEYACRAGTTTVYSSGDDENQFGEYAWYYKNSNQTHPTGEKRPNAWGLSDMHGNVWEWCQDRHADYPGGSVTDPTGAASGSDRESRGGGWDSGSRYCRSAYRSGYSPDTRYFHRGFRVVHSSIKSVAGGGTS